MNHSYFWFIVNLLYIIASCAEVIHFNEHKVTPVFTIVEFKSGNVKTQKVFSHSCPYITRRNIKLIRYNNCPCKCVKCKEQWNTVIHTVTAIKILKQDIHIHNNDALGVVILSTTLLLCFYLKLLFMRKTSPITFN